MPNDLSTHTWRLDTPLAFGNVGAVLWKSYEYIKQIEWSNFATGNQLILKDQTGRIIWQVTAGGTTSGDPIRLGDVGWQNGLVLDTLTGGLVTIYIK